MKPKNRSLEKYVRLLSAPIMHEAFKAIPHEKPPTLINIIRNQPPDFEFEPFYTFHDLSYNKYALKDSLVEIENEMCVVTENLSDKDKIAYLQYVIVNLKNIDNDIVFINGYWIHSKLTCSNFYYDQLESSRKHTISYIWLEFKNGIRELIDSAQHEIEKGDHYLKHVIKNADNKANNNLVSFRIRSEEVLSNENLRSIMDKMLRAKLIQETSLNQLRTIFTGVIITEKICWVKSVGSLHYFIDRLTNFPTPSFEKGVVHIEKNKWQIACACFTYRNKELSSRTLSRNKGPQSSKVKGDIDNIIKDLQ